MGFGMTTFLLNLHNLGLYALDSMILGMGIFMGGLAQVLAGYMEWKKGNTFGATAFTSYGMFWLALVALLILPALGIGAKSDPTSFASFLAIWGVFSAALFLGTLRMNRALQVVFGSLTLLFALLALGNGLVNTDIIRVAGAVGVFCALSAMYTGLAQVLNEVYGKTVAPIWPVARVDLARRPMEKPTK
ncbi:MAG: acetate uptake transporter [Methanomassiliicoccales archaeon]|nr:acetate uptake transporter [Methanomassiliicoccales archaeon]